MTHRDDLAGHPAPDAAPDLLRDAAPGPGHNAAPPHHLHSHMPHGHAHSHDDPEAAEAVEDLAAAFIEGFREAEDKVSFLRLAGIPFALDGEDGRSLKLVDVALRTEFQVGTASPGFGSRELVYLPFAGAMVRERAQVSLVYVSLTERRDIPVADLLRRGRG